MSDVANVIDTEGKTFFSREPVLLLHAVTSAVVYAATSVGLDQARADKLVNLVVPPAVVLLLMVQGLLIRRFVTPAWKRLQVSAAHDGVDVPDLPAPPDLTSEQVAELATVTDVGAAVMVPPPAAPVPAAVSASAV